VGAMLAWKIVSRPLLGLGYSLVLWNVLVHPSAIERILNHGLSQAVGRISYSFYLWHWWPCKILADAVTARLGSTVGAQYLSFVLAFVAVGLISIPSYRWLEAPYFKKARPVAL